MDKPVAAHVLRRIRAEYVEMPGLALNASQVQRLCGMDDAVCQSVLDALVASGFLSRRPDGSYARSTGADIARTRPAKSRLESSADAAAKRGRSRAS